MERNTLTREPPHKRAALILTTVLWLIAAALTMLCIFALREVLIWGLGTVLANTLTKHEVADMINLANQCSMIGLGIVAIIVAIGGTEYTFRHAGEPRLIRWMLRLITVEAVIVVPAALFFWIH